MSKISLGYVLTKYRQKFNLTREQVVAKISIPHKTLVSLEEHNGIFLRYEKVTEALKRLCYLYHLKYDEVEKIYQADVRNTILVPPQIVNLWSKLSITDRSVRYVLFGGGVTSIVAYVIWQTLFFITGPNINLNNFADFQYVDSDSIEIDGKVDAGGKLTLNDREIILETDGFFTVDVPLASGINPLEFAVEGAHGEKTVLQKTIYLNRKNDE